MQQWLAAVLLPDCGPVILAIAEEPWRTLFTTLAMTGLRAGEALGLQVGDLDFGRMTITVRRSAW